MRLSLSCVSRYLFLMILLFNLSLNHCMHKLLDPYSPKKKSRPCNIDMRKQDTRSKESSNGSISPRDSEVGKKNPFFDGSIN